MKNTIIVTLLIVLAGVGIYLFTQNIKQDSVNTGGDTTMTDESKDSDDLNIPTGIDGVEDKTKTVIGSSVNGTDIIAYHFGEGDTNLLFVGGIHGGYEWNTVLVARQLMEYLGQNPESIPANLKVSIIPVLNPDGLEKTIGTAGEFTASNVPTATQELVAGRFNANNVDLNRNFDCDWQAEGVWQSKAVSGGSSAFSEPESQAFKSYVENTKPAGVVVWYSAAGGVYASSCHNGVPAQTLELTKLFAQASGYPAHEEFDFYTITGDAVNWLAKQNIPAISVLLTNHQDTEWSKNLAGIKAVFDYYGE